MSIFYDLIITRNYIQFRTIKLSLNKKLFINAQNKA